MTFPLYAREDVDDLPGWLETFLFMGFRLSNKNQRRKPIGDNLGLSEGSRKETNWG
mgnify:CR=1 FL=1